MDKIRVAVVGRGNIGRYAAAAVLTAADMELCGIVGRSSLAPMAGVDTPVVSDIAQLEKVDAALLCLPSRSVPEYVKKCIALGIATVDSFDEHARIKTVRRELDAVCKEKGIPAILSAGWDPGTDSVLRALLLAMAPQGVTHTNFGPGMSMGHSVAARAIPGVRDALSITVPMGLGMHKRQVYLQLEAGADFEAVKEALLRDEYFAHDEVHVFETQDVAALRDAGHGVHLERKGTASGSPNQMLEFSMRVNNPAVTAQIMTSSARALPRLRGGCYTLIEVPPVLLLPGEAEDWVGKLV